MLVAWWNIHWGYFSELIQYFWSRHVVYLRITNSLPLRAPAQPHLKLCSVSAFPNILGFFDPQVPELISLVQQVLFEWNIAREFAPSLLVWHRHDTCVWWDMQPYHTNALYTELPFIVQMLSTGTSQTNNTKSGGWGVTSRARAHRNTVISDVAVNTPELTCKLVWKQTYHLR